jgi:tetratricopeptide (TPR) repeat protein
MMIKEHPLVGVGPGNWQILFPKYGLGNFDLAEIQNGMTTFQRPHNDFLWIFSETGIPGLICYLLLFIVSFKFGFRLLKSVSDNNSQALYKHLLSGLAAYLTVSFFDFPIERIEHQILLFTMLAIISSDYILKNNPKKDLPTKTIQVRSLIAFIIPVMLFSLVITCSRLIGEYHTRKLISAHHHNNWKTMISESDKAMNMFYQLDPTSAPISWYKGVALFATENIKTANSSFENAYYTHPYNLHVLNNLASSYEKLGDHEKAEQYYKEALSIFPAFDEARLNLSAVYYNKGLFEKAFIIIDQCDTNCIDPKYLIFLPAILNEKAKIILQKATPMDDKRFRFRSFSNDKLLEIYFLSKRKNIRFEDEIVTQLNQPV